MPTAGGYGRPAPTGRIGRLRIDELRITGHGFASGATPRPAPNQTCAATETGAVEQGVEADGASRPGAGKIGRVAACAFAHRRRSLTRCSTDRTGQRRLDRRGDAPGQRQHSSNPRTCSRTAGGGKRTYTLRTTASSRGVPWLACPPSEDVPLRAAGTNRPIGVNGDRCCRTRR